MRRAPGKDPPRDAVEGRAVIVVTGSAGFIGRAVVDVLAERGLKVRHFDHPHDVRFRDDLDQAFDGAEGVINLAGALGTAEMFGSEEDAVRVNIGGAVNVYDAAAARGIPVVQIGTGHKGQPNPYAITKAAAEDLGLARARWCDQPINVVRAFHAYGPGQKVCPPHGTGHVRKIIPSFVCRALTGMPLEVNGAGQQAIDLVHVDDIAVVLVDALAAPYGRVIEAGTGLATKVYDAARTVIRATDSTSSVAFKTMRRGEPEQSWVVAADPACPNRWPHRLDETIDYYRAFLASS